MSHQWPYNLMWIVMMCTGAPIYVIGQRDCMCCGVVTCAVFIELHWMWIPYLIATYSYIYRSKLSPSTALNIVHSRVVSVTYYTRSNRVGFIKHAEQQKVHRILLTTSLSLSLYTQCTRKLLIRIPIWLLQYYMDNVDQWINFSLVHQNIRIFNPKWSRNPLIIIMEQETRAIDLFERVKRPEYYYCT